MTSEIDRARRELANYPGDEIPVVVAVTIMSRGTGLKIHLLTPDEIPRALSHAKVLIREEKVHERPSAVKNEVVRSSEEQWQFLSTDARTLVGALWTSEVNSDLVMTTLDPIQPKDKMLNPFENLLATRERFPLGSRQDSGDQGPMD